MADGREVIVQVGSRWVVVLAPPEKLRGVLAAVRGVVRDVKGEVGTVTGVRYGLGVRVPVEYADAVHSAVFGPPADQEGVVDTPGPVAPVEAAGDPQARRIEDDSVEVPPVSGRGSGIAAWRAHLDAHGLTYDQALGRDELVELWNSQ